MWGRPCCTVCPLQLSEAMEEDLMTPFTLTSLMHLKPAPCEDHCQNQLQAWGGAWPASFILAAFLYCESQGADNPTAFYFYKLRLNFVWSCPEGTLSIVKIQISRPLLMALISLSRRASHSAHTLAPTLIFFHFRHSAFLSTTLVLFNCRSSEYSPLIHTTQFLH